MTKVSLIILILLSVCKICVGDEMISEQFVLKNFRSFYKKNSDKLTFAIDNDEIKIHNILASIDVDKMQKVPTNERCIITLMPDSKDSNSCTIELIYNTKRDEIFNNSVNFKLKENYLEKKIITTIPIEKKTITLIKKNGFVADSNTIEGDTLAIIIYGINELIVFYKEQDIFHIYGAIKNVNEESVYWKIMRIDFESVEKERFENKENKK